MLVTLRTIRISTLSIMQKLDINLRLKASSFTNYCVDCFNPFLKFISRFRFVSF